MRETARHLAVWMSFEDLIRVAQAKIDPARMERIEQELGAKPGEPYHVTEFLKPGIEEVCQVLPPRLARRIISYSEKRGWLDKVHVGMYVTTTSVSGYLRFWLLAKLDRCAASCIAMSRSRRRSNPGSAWSPTRREAFACAALEVAECARLIKGYGFTHKRGTQNFQMIETRVILPALNGQIRGAGRDRRHRQRPYRGAARSRGQSGLAKCLDELDARLSFRIAAE